MSKTSHQTILSPFTVLIDTREQLPYAFSGLRADCRQQYRPLNVLTSVCTLSAGDYSIDGYADSVGVERKSLADLCGTLTAGRGRFVRELERLNSMDASWVVCEAELSYMMRCRLKWSKLVKKTLWRSVMAFQLRFPRVHWWGCPGRAVAEAVTYRLLEKWWQERVGKGSAINEIVK